MAKQTKLTVTTDAGTFTRTTARTYSHVVVGRYTAAEQEKNRLYAISAYTNRAAYADKTADDREAGIVSRYDSRTAAEHRAQAAVEREQAAALVAKGVITDDAPHGVLGWAGRLDLAVKLATGREGRRNNDVRIYALDGTRVR